MKKIGLILLILTLSLSVNAQIRWGVKAGGNLSKMTMKNDDGDKADGLKNRFGFHLGAMMEYSFAPSFALQPELIFIQNGFGLELQTEIEGYNAEFKFKIPMSQIQLPINLKYKLGDDKLNFFVTAGPYLGYGLSGKLKLDKATVGGLDITSEVKKEMDGDDSIYGDDGSFKRFDFGIGAGIGVEVSKFMIGAGYQFGLMNLSSEKAIKSKMGTFQFSVGYFF